jgi:hypothetical protein
MVVFIMSDHMWPHQDGAAYAHAVLWVGSRRDYTGTAPPIVVRCISRRCGMS